MNVLQVNKFYHPKVGGIEKVTKDIAEGIAGNHESRVLASKPRGYKEQYTYNDVKVYKTTSIGTALSVPLSPDFPIAYRFAVGKSNLVHHHLPNPLGVVSDHLTQPSVPTVASYHSDIVRQMHSLRIYEPLLNRFLSRCDRIIVTSPMLRDNSEYLESFRGKCTVVPLSVNINEVAQKGTPPFDIDEPVILFSGRLNYYKGVEYLIEAMQQVDAHLVIAGDGDNRRALEKRAQECNVDDRTTFLGYVTDEELRGAYQSSDLFVLPSIEESEAFGIVQLEAMANGLPVVNTNLPTGVPWVSLDGETGRTVEPENSDALAGAIRELLSDDELRRDLGRNARCRVERRFTRERMLDQIETIYDEVSD